MVAEEAANVREFELLSRPKHKKHHKFSTDLRKTRSTSSNNKTINRAHAYTAFRNSRSGHNLSPKNKKRLSTAKNTRYLASPSNKKKVKAEDRLPQLSKHHKSKLNKRSSTHPHQRKNILFFTNGKNNSTDVDMTAYKVDFDDMLKNRSKLKTQAKRYKVLAEGPMTVTKQGKDLKKLKKKAKCKTKLEKPIKHIKPHLAPKEVPKKHPLPHFPLTDPTLSHLQSTTIINANPQKSSSISSQTPHIPTLPKAPSPLKNIGLNADLEISFDEDAKSSKNWKEKQPG